MNDRFRISNLLAGHLREHKLSLPGLLRLAGLPPGFFEQEKIFATFQGWEGTSPAEWRTKHRPMEAAALGNWVERETIMEIKRCGSQPSGKGPEDWFSGTVRIDPLLQITPPARTAAASVTFEPGARTAWHTHPLGQTLIVTFGCGRVQREGGPIEEIRPGDVVAFAPGEKHWHGAAPTTAMTHIAIQEQLDGKVVEWMEKVSDEQYQAS